MVAAMIYWILTSIFPTSRRDWRDGWRGATSGTVVRMDTDDPIRSSSCANSDKSFGDNEVLKGIDLDVAPGEVVVIFGRSGSGKSTLLRCINFLEEPTSGSVEVGGIGSRPGRRTAPAGGHPQMRIKTGMVFQDFNLFPT